MEGDPERWKKWGNCKNPKLDISGDIINAGADDDYGAFWHVTDNFGCIFFEVIRRGEWQKIHIFENYYETS